MDDYMPAHSNYPDPHNDIHFHRSFIIDMMQSFIQCFETQVNKFVRNFFGISNFFRYLNIFKSIWHRISNNIEHQTNWVVQHSRYVNDLFSSFKMMSDH